MREAGRDLPFSFASHSLAYWQNISKALKFITCYQLRLKDLQMLGFLLRWWAQGKGATLLQSLGVTVHYRLIYSKVAVEKKSFFFIQDVEYLESQPWLQPVPHLSLITTPPVNHSAGQRLLNQGRWPHAWGLLHTEGVLTLFSSPFVSGAVFFTHCWVPRITSLYL